MNEEEFNIENHLRDLRKRQHLSQEELAHELGVSRQSIISLEQGRSLPSLPLVITLCNFFDSSFEELFRFGQEMDRMLEDNVVAQKEGAEMPSIDIKDKKDSIEVRAELPGINEDEIDIEISEGVMTISGEKKENSSTESEGYYYKESRTGSFSRSFTLPADIAAEEAEAEMKNGVLTITLPKVEPKKATKVKISPKKKLPKTGIDL
jgi:HSP20 family protein